VAMLCAPRWDTMSGTYGATAPNRLTVVLNLEHILSDHDAASR
jgi:hypothetical protein